MFCCLSTSSADTARAVAHACSPRVGVVGSAAIFDVSGCARTIGPPDVILREVLALAGDGARAAIAPTVTAAWLLAAARPGTIAASANVRTALAPVPLGWLGAVAELDAGGASPSRLTPEAIRDVIAIAERWGLRTFGDLAALPAADVLSRLGPAGARLHQAATGQDAAPFAPTDEPPPFADRLDLEWPIEGLEPLAFVLARLCDRLSARLVLADRGAVRIRTRLALVTREAHERALELPSPVADARVLRTLILLDLESHPPPAAIDAVAIDLDVSPGPIVQGSLIAPALPAPEELATLLARLTALMGASRVGAPMLVDTHDARAVAMQPFACRMEKVSPRSRSGPRPSGEAREAQPAGALPPRAAVRRWRLPVAARVDVERHRPVRVWPSARGLPGGVVTRAAGPWRSSGRWWDTTRGAWDRDEWDVEIEAGGVYRLARDRSSGRWEVEGIVD